MKPIVAAKAHEMPPGLSRPGGIGDCQKSVFDSLSMKIYDFHRICSPLQRTNFVNKICTFAV